MSTLHERIHERLAVTGKSYRKASLDGGMSPEGISKILGIPANSPTLETVRKLALGLETTPEWLAYGVGQEAPLVSKGPKEEESSHLTDELLLPQTFDISDLPDNASIHIEVGFLRAAVSGALQGESIPSEQADAYADAVLVSLRAQLTSSVVYQITKPSRNGPVSSRPKLVGRR